MVIPSVFGGEDGRVNERDVEPMRRVRHDGNDRRDDVIDRHDVGLHTGLALQFAQHAKSEEERHGAD